MVGEDWGCLSFLSSPPSAPQVPREAPPCPDTMWEQGQNVLVPPSSRVTSLCPGRPCTQTIPCPPKQRPNPSVVGPQHQEMTRGVPPPCQGLPGGFSASEPPPPLQGPDGPLHPALDTLTTDVNTKCQKKRDQSQAGGAPGEGQDGAPHPRTPLPIPLQ